MKKVLIASLLKPVTDPRMYLKMGLSLAKEGYNVHIAGFTAPVPSAKKVIFYPLFKFKRISFQRAFASIRILKLLLKVKPDLFILTSPELLWVGVIFRLITKKPAVYDVQEDYFKNLRYMKTMPVGINSIMATGVRLLEKITAPFLSGFILAERIYSKELSFVKNRYIIAENKYKKAEVLPERRTPYVHKSERITFLYSGTIAEEFGIWKALSFIERLHRYNPSVRLIIYGYAPLEKLRLQLADYLIQKNYVLANVWSTPVPYNKITEAFTKTDFLLLPYCLNNAIVNKVPTKLFEGIALKIPMVIEENEQWKAFCSRYNAAEFINFQDFSPDDFLESLKNSRFYIHEPGKEVLWESCEKDLFKFVETVLK